MQISLAKNSEVPLRHQLAEQIVFLITTGQLRRGEEMPSVRALARLLKIHHNTVSEAYQDLVIREWLSRRRGSRLTVGAIPGTTQKIRPTLDELINESIQKAKDMGYSLQALRERVSERLLTQPPDHILVVEEEPGLRMLIRREIQENIDWSVETCSWQAFVKEPGLAIGAQVVAPNHTIGDLKALVPESRPPIPIIYSRADGHLEIISSLKRPSIIAVASISESLLKTARGLLAAAVTRKHVFQEFLLPGDDRLELKGIDLAFCDTVAIPLIGCRKKIRYQLIAPDCFEHLSSALDLSDQHLSSANKPYNDSNGQR